MITFEQFQEECQRLAKLNPETARWALQFRTEDLGREWVTHVRDGLQNAMVRSSSASATITTAQDVLGQAGLLLRELRDEARA